MPTQGGARAASGLSPESPANLSTDTRVPKPRSRSNTKGATTSKDGSGNRQASEVGRQSRVVVRKRLPWLDSPQQSKPGQIPGHFESKESLTAGDANDSPPPVPARHRNTSKRVSTASLGKDPALRAVGSTPSLRTRARSGNFKSLSLSSQPRSGIKPVSSRKDAKLALGMVDEQQHGTHYTSSEYSASPSSDKEPMPANLPMKDPSSYERLVERRISAKPEPHESFHLANPWLQSQLDLQLESEASPGHSPDDERGTGQDEDPPNAAVRSPRHHRRTHSCRSCDQEPILRPMPKAKTFPRRSVAIPPAEPTMPPPPPPPTRKPTLFAMPSHLLPSSSSSSHDPTPHVPAAQSPPSAPPRASMPSSNAMHDRDIRRQSQSLSRAVTGLETLMEEALTVARDAAQNGRNDEVANILEGATLALRKASTVHGQMGTGRMSHPLVLSPAVSERGSDSDSVGPYSDASSTRSTGRSVETAPTLLTKSAQSSKQPILDSQKKATGRSSMSLKPLADDGYGTRRGLSLDRQSMSTTPPRLYQPPSADSIVRDFAYASTKTAKAEAARQLSKSYGAASDYYGDAGQSVGTQPGMRPSLSAPIITGNPLPPLPAPTTRPSIPLKSEVVPPKGGRQSRPVRRLEPVATTAIPPRVSSRSYEKFPDTEARPRKRQPKHDRQHLSDFFESSYYHQDHKDDHGLPESNTELQRGSSLVTDARYDPNTDKRVFMSKSATRYSGPTTFLQRNFSLKHPRRAHISLRENQGFSLGRYHRRQPIAREWNTLRKRITATIACMNTVFVGLIAGIYVSDNYFNVFVTANEFRLEKYQGFSTNWQTRNTK